MNEFESFIVKCCEMDEWDLRDFLRETLREHGFTIQEDDYQDHRRGNYQDIHNMLAIRGACPRVCFVAHTDVVRDGGWGKQGKHQRTDPVIKEHYGKRIIQDRHCQVQVGGDDRLGVAINVFIATHTGYDMGLLFSCNEESGGGGSDYVSFPELNEFELLAQVDRGHHYNELITNIYGTQICSKPMAERLLSISEEIGYPRTPEQGLFTDVKNIKGNGMCKEAVNMTCGYYRGHSRDEYIVVQEAWECLQFCVGILNDFEEEVIDDLEQEPQVSFETEEEDDLDLEAINSCWS